MRAFAAGLALAVLLLAGCSDDNSEDDSADMGDMGMDHQGMGSMMQSVDLAVSSTGAYPANPGFDPSDASVPAGAMVHVTFTNGDALPIQHNWVVMGIENATSETIGQGQSTSFDFMAPAEAGEYTVYCSIGDHRSRGMEGTLTVTA